MSDTSEVFDAIQAHPGLRTSQIADMLDPDMSRERVEDAIWVLWSEGRIQIEPSSTLRVTREGEKVFRHFFP